MRLTDLHPVFLSSGGEGITRDGEPVPLQEGVGVEFDCPCGCSSPCFVPFANPIGDGPPCHDKGWQRTGETFETLRLSPSILRKNGCGWHGHVGLNVPGEVTSC